MKGVQARMGFDECRNQPAPVNRMIVPDQHNGSRDGAQELRQKNEHDLAGERTAPQLAEHTDSPATRGNRQSPNRVDPLVMRDLGANNRRLTAWRPRGFEGRNQRKSALIFEYQGRAQPTTLFLSAAIRFQSTPQWRRHPVAGLGAWASDCSSPSAASRTKPHWGESGCETPSKSNGRSDPVSNGLQHSHARGRHVSIEAPGAAPAGRSTVAGVLGAVAPVSCRRAPLWPSAVPCAQLFQPAKPLAWGSTRLEVRPTRASAVHRLVDCCPLFAWHPFSRMRHSFIKGQ